MNFREEVKMAVEESLRGYGASESAIRFALIGVDTGFSAGTLNDSEREVQVDMLKALLNTETIN